MTYEGLMDRFLLGRCRYRSAETGKAGKGGFKTEQQNPVDRVSDVGFSGRGGGAFKRSTEFILIIVCAKGVDGSCTARRGAALSPRMRQEGRRNRGGGETKS